MREYREMNLVRFALNKGDTPKFFALTDKTYDTWLTGEPQEGYHIFEYLGNIQVEVFGED